MKNSILCMVLAVLAALAASCAPTQVQRHAWVTGLKPQKAETYRKLHANPWPSVNANLKTQSHPNPSP